MHILPDLSAESLLQCHIFHSTTDSTFVCLSYVWNYLPPTYGKSHEEADVAILLNGQIYYVRPNLFDFLCMARRNSIEATWEDKFDLSTPFWIDALCIDQSNPSERIHQVAHMGNIYSKASAVHAWLGNHLRHATRDEVRGVIMAEANRQIRLAELGHDLEFSESIRSDIELMASKKDIDNLGKSLMESLHMNPYWQRAWVVQEVFLAQNLTFWLLSEPFSQRFLRRLASQILESRTIMKEELVMDGTHYLDFHFSNFKHDKKADLIDLLDQYADKQCADPRDRIYSLLALCTEWSKVEVDYSIELQDLAYGVLECHPGKLSLCVAAIVAQTLWARPATSDTACGLENGPWIKFDVSHERFEVHPDNNRLLTSLELSSICDCFHRGFYPVPD